MIAFRGTTTVTKKVTKSTISAFSSMKSDVVSHLEPMCRALIIKLVFPSWSLSGFGSWTLWNATRVQFIDL